MMDTNLKFSLITTIIA
ncbi:TPA: YnhF family membrane protein, partial [Klebsiella pneumoniae]|nr:YnhF family membrane protein [Klebsiella pneumoniae]